MTAEGIADDADAVKAHHKKDVEPPLDAHSLEIQYKDPVHGLPCREHVFFDRNDPTNRSKAPRLLVSVESVNLLRQSHKSTENKLQVVRDDLNASRLTFHAELQRLREQLVTLVSVAPDLSEKIAASMINDASGPDQAQEKSPHLGPQAGYQVYYYRVEEYLDDRATELLKVVIEKVRKELSLEIEQLLEQVDALGGKGNKQIFVLLLQSGASFQKITEDLVKLMCTDEDERRNMENALTNGLRDKLDFLIRKEESLHKELETSKERLDEIDQLKGQQHRAIEELRMKVKDAREELSDLKEQAEKVSHEKESLALQVDMLKKQVEAQNAAERAALKKEREEIEESHKVAFALAQQAEHEANERHKEICGMLALEESKPMPVEEDNTEKIQAIDLAKRRVEEAILLKENWENRLSNAEASKKSHIETLGDLKSKLGPLKEELTQAPAPDPRREEYEKIQEGLASLEQSKKKLQKDIENSKKQMVTLKDTVKTSKKVLGVKKSKGGKKSEGMEALGIDLSLVSSDSDSEEDEGGHKNSDEDPAVADYRERRKLAAFGKKGLPDIGKFLHDDGESRRRRSLKQIEKWKKSAMKNMLRVLNANAGIKVEDEEILAECEQMFGKDSAMEGTTGSSPTLKQPDPLRVTWPHGFGKPVQSSNAEAMTSSDQQAEILERRLVASERRTSEAQRRLDSAAWTSCRLQDLIQDLGCKLQNALSEERALREELPCAVQSFLATLPAELSRGEVESLLSQFQETLQELKELEDAVGEAAALIEGQDVEAQKEGSPNRNLAACRLRFEEHAMALRDSINQAVYAAQELGLMTELMTWTVKVDNVIMALTKHQDARAELAAQVLQVSEALQREQQIEEQSLVVIQTEEARQRSLANDLEKTNASFTRGISQIGSEQSSVSRTLVQEALMDRSPERWLGPSPDSRASSPLLGDLPSSPEALPALHGRRSSEAEIFGTRLASEGSRRKRRTTRRISLRRATPGCKAHTTDFGFRQDGEGEESVENWALFKVTKSPDQKDRRGDANGSRRHTMAAFPRELRISNSEPKLRQNTSCFRDYISKCGFPKQDIIDAHQRASVWGTNRHRHSLPVIAGIAGPTM